MKHDEFEDDLDPDLEGIDEKSKSQVKREYKALQKLGEDLLHFNAGQLAELPLSEDVLRAVEEGRKIKPHSGGHKRQVKYIGKKLAELDTEALWEAVEQQRDKDRLNNARFHLVEEWRDRLLAEQDAALAQFVDDYPSADRQALRQLIRNAQREAEKQQPPKAARQLFKALREIMLD